MPQGHFHDAREAGKKSSTVGTQIRVPRAMGMGVGADHEGIFLGLWGHVTQYKLLRSSKLSQHPMT